VSSILTRLRQIKQENTGTSEDEVPVVLIYNINIVSVPGKNNQERGVGYT
jgi:hypothetical protein